MRIPLFALLALAACPSGSSGTLYVIPAGAHDSGLQVSVHSGDVLAFTATFDHSAISTSVDPRNQGDINKLYGFSDCTSHHHSNSARFGWRWFDDELQIHAYTYADGLRDSQLVATAGIGVAHTYEIEIVGDEYVFTFDHQPPVVMGRGCSTNLVKYRLYPYFGGDETAPHDVSIHIDER